MILVDTSVWIDHFRVGIEELSRLLDQDEVSMHPFVIGEIALGSIGRRSEVLELLGELPRASVATPNEVLELIEQRALSGIGIGYVDAHILASAVLTPGTRLWAHDTRLAGAAERLGIAVNRPN